MFVDQAQSPLQCDVRVHSFSLGVFSLIEVQQVFKAKKFELEAEHKESQNPIVIEISQHVRAESFSTKFDVDLFKVWFQGFVQRDLQHISGHVAKIGKWEDVDAVAVAIETLQPIDTVWNAGAAETFVINAMPRVFQGYKSQLVALESTLSATLVGGLRSSLDSMNEKVNELIKQIREKGDDCNPHFILPQSQYGGFITQNFSIMVDGKTIKLRGDKEAVSKVKKGIQWLQTPLLTEVLWNVKKEMDGMYAALVNEKNKAIVVDEQLVEIFLALLNRYVDATSGPGFGSMPLIWIILTSGKSQQMALTVKILKKYQGIYSIADSILILKTLVESSLNSGDNFEELQKVVLKYSRYVARRLGAKDKDKRVEEHWNWVPVFIQWCFDRWAAARNVAEVTKIVNHCKDLHKDLGLFSRAWFAGGILKYLWRNHKHGVPQTFINYIENDLDITDWRYKLRMNV